MRAAPTDWNAVQRRLLKGDRLAFLELNRLITGFLVQLRAYDFRDEWDDLRQEVVMSLVANTRVGRLRDPRAFVGYVRIITRNKFVDRLKRRLRHQERESLPWDDASAEASALPPPEEGERLWSAVRELPEEQRRVIEEVYLNGRTYQEASDETGIPLGTMKRRLRDGLLALRQRFEGMPEDA
ncbi:MAG: RNA polymerase sigma factor [Myxococcota bacterium]